MSVLLQCLGQQQEALAHIQRAHSLAPRHVQTVYNYVLLLIQAQKVLLKA